MEIRTPGLRSENSTISTISTLEAENERLRAENAELRANLLAANSSNEQFRLIADYSPVLIALVDPDERYVFMNQLYQKWFGFEPENAIGKTILEVVGHCAREKVKDQIQSALQGNHVHFENPVTLMGGGAKTVDLQFIPVWYPTKNANGFVILGYDMTERNLLADQYRAITELTPQFVWMSDEKGSIHYSNSTLLNYMGVTDSATLGDRWLERLHPDDREKTMSLWRDSIAMAKPYEIEFRIRSKDGGYGWFLNRALPMRESKDGRIDRWLGVSTDITKLKETEFALAQSEEHFSFLYEASSILASSLNYNETLARLAEVAVPQLADWCSISVVEESGPKTIALSHPDPAMKKIAEDFRLKYPEDWSSDQGAARVLKTGKAELHEWVSDEMIAASAKDPEHLRLIRALKIRSMMIVPIVSRGETLGVLTLISSGDDRKYAKADLKIAEEIGKRAGLAIDNARLFTQGERERAKLSVIFAQAPVGIAVLEGPDHIFSMVNSSYRSLYGGRNDFVGRSVRDAVPEATEQGFINVLNRVYQTGEPFVGKEIPLELLQNNGTRKHFYIDFVYQPLRNLDQKIYGIVAVIQDVTEQVQSRATLETIFQASPAAMVLWKGSELVFDKMNPGYQAIFSDRELLGKPFSEALPETKGQPFEQWIKHVFETGEPRVQQEQLARLVLYRGGPIEDRYFDMAFVRVMGVDHKPYGVYEHAVDVTDRVLSRRALEASKRELETTVQSLKQERELREQFVSTLTHDLRNPLGAAHMSAQLLSVFFDSPEKLTSLSGRIIDNLNRTNQMIENLLDANRIKAGEPLQLEMQETDLVSLAKTTLSELTSTLGDRFVLDSPEALIKGVWSADAVRRILENLCSNAIKYGFDRTPVTVRLRQDPTHIHILVHNYGKPIPPEEVTKLFEPYSRISSSNSTKSVKGWGLGLTLVKGLTEAHGGRVSVSSNAQDGTLFTIQLLRDATPTVSK